MTKLRASGKKLPTKQSATKPVVEAQAKPRYAIYGGTFDPVHNGHLFLAQAAMEFFQIERLWFVPCARNPLKSGGPVASNEDRLQMLKRAVRGLPGIEVSDFELHRPAPSYAIDTAKHFAALHPEADWFWLLGTDQVKALPRWHRYSELKQAVRFLWLQRGPGLRRGALAVRYDISATQVRERLAAGKPIRSWVPDRVEQYILQHRLYGLTRST